MKQSALQAIAQDSTGPAPVDISEVETSVSIKKSKESVDRLRTTYQNQPDAVFQAWRREDHAITEGTRDHYWKTYEDLYPGSTVDAQQSVRDEIDFELRTRPTAESKEFYLRDRITQLPNWAQDEYGEQLLTLAQNSARQNSFKSQASYSKDFKERMARFLDEPLDVDVPAHVHTKEILRMEQKNLLDSSVVLDGRLVLSDKDGQIRPAFAVNHRSDIFENDDFGEASIEEEMVISQLAPSIIQSVVERNLSKGRAKIAEQNKIISMQTHKALANGEVTRDQWGGAFSVIEAPVEQKIIAAISGEIDAGRVKSDTDLARMVYEALAEFGEPNATI